MTAATFPVACILAFLTYIVLRIVFLLIVRCVAGFSRWVTMRHLARECGSRARANRLLRAIERETLNGIPPMAYPALPQAKAAAPVERPAGLAARVRALEPFRHLMFARRQAD